MSTVARDAPLLLLDADADPTITERIAEGADFISIQSPPIADIVQVSDLTLSNSWLLDPKKGAARRESVLAILRREVQRAEAGGVLVVATKSVLQALHADAGQPVKNSDDDEGLRRPLLGATPRWFGPRTQGVNDFEDFAAIVVIGRLQPHVMDVEKSARAVCSRDASPIPAHVSGALPAQPAGHLMADGTVANGVVNTHPDQRVHAVLSQTRECGTLQAIARLRLVSPRRAKRVVILSNLPLPNFPVGRLVTFDALVHGLEQEADPEGFLRMEAALRATMGRQVRGTRLSAKGLWKDLPLNFGSDDSGKEFRRGRSSQQLLALCQRVAAANDWPITVMQLQGKAGGKPVPAIVLAPPKKAMSMARSLWPDFTPHRTKPKKLLPPA